MSILGANIPADVRKTSRAWENLSRVYVWDLVVRVCHWTIVLCVVALAITGYYIGRPSLVVPGEATQHFVMGDVRSIHHAFALAFILAVVVRIYWSFVGSPPARWPNFVPVTRDRWLAARETLWFYLFRRDRFPPTLSHNPLAGLTYSVVVAVFLMMIGTGGAMYAASAPHSLWRPFLWLLPVLGGLQVARWTHHIGMWLLLGFFVHHIYSAVLAASVEKNGILESIFTGYKWVRREQIERR